MRSKRSRDNRGRFIDRSKQPEPLNNIPRQAVRDRTKNIRDDEKALEISDGDCRQQDERSVAETKGYAFVDQRKSFPNGAGADASTPLLPPESPKITNLHSLQPCSNSSHRGVARLNPLHVISTASTPNVPTRVIPPSRPHMIWAKTLNQLNTTCERVEALRTRNDSCRAKLTEAEARLCGLITRVKQIEKSKLGLDWDAVVASRKTDTQDIDAKTKGLRSELANLERVLTRHDIKNIESDKQQAIEAQIEAAAQAQERFETNARKYVEEFQAKIRKRSKVSQEEVQEHDALVEEIQRIYAEITESEKELCNDIIRQEEEWMTKLANLAIDSGMPQLIDSVDLVESGRTFIEQELKEKSNLASSSTNHFKPILQNTQLRPNLMMQKRVSETNENECYKSEQSTKIDKEDDHQGINTETVRRTGRTRVPTARKLASLDELH